MNIANLLLRTAKLYPLYPALFHGDREISTYAQFADRAARIAGGLIQAGCRPGDRLAVLMINSPAYLEVLYGIWWAGLTAIPINAKLHPEEVAYIARNARCHGMIVSPQLNAPLLDDDLPHLRLVVGTPQYERVASSEPASLVSRAADDPAWLFYTSGTTGKPKGVIITHRNIMAMTSCFFANVDDACASDAIVYAAPMSHGAGLYNFPYVLHGARHIVPMSAGFDPAELASLAQQAGPISLFAAPTMVRRLVDHVGQTGCDTSGFKTIIYGGGPMYVSDIKLAIETMGSCFVQIYGQGESPMTITVLPRQMISDRTHPQWEQRLASVGFAQPLVEVQIAADDGQLMAPGETGEVLVRGDSVMAGYWDNPEATAQTIRDGWLRTGDMGSMDEFGLLTLKDRSKDLIICGGSNIYPREVEEVLLRHLAVSEVSVVGQPDAEWGEIVVAFVVGDAASEPELDALCLRHIARFKRPKFYRFVESLPKNNYGKVLKTELRKQLHQP